jgi:hypothetical protein
LVKKFIPLICLALLLLSGCGVTRNSSAAGAPQPAPSLEQRGLTVSIRREACFGFCPVYSLTVRGDGSVIFEGENHVAMTGTHAGTLTPEQTQELALAIEESGYFDLKDQYTTYEVTDLPYTTTTVTLDGRTKTIRHYHGDRGAPEQLTRFENTIDRVANTRQWIGR